MFKDYNSTYPNNISLNSNEDIAIINAVDNSQTTYAELNNKIASVSDTLKSKGFNRRNRILVSSDFSNTDQIPTLMGIVNISSVVPVNVDHSVSEIEFIIRHGNICLIICQEHEFHFIDAAKNCDIPYVFFGNIQSAIFRNIIACEETEGMGCCASGTSHEKRLIPIPRTRMHYWAFNSFRMPGKDTRALIIIPLMNSGGFSHMISALMNGGIAIIPKSIYPNDVEYAYNLYKPNHVHGAPISYRNFMKIDLKEYTIKHCRITGSKASSDLIRNIFEVIKPEVVNSVYGTNENGPAFVNIMTKDSINESIGEPDHGYEYKIDENQHIWVRGGSGHPEFYDTGDLAEIKDGKVYLIGRSDDVIVTDPHSVNPQEVEEILLMHEGINDIAIFGKEVESTSSKICCVYVGDVEEHNLILYAKENLVSYKIPVEWNRVEEIPLNTNGKISRKRLQELF